MCVACYFLPDLAPRQDPNARLADAVVIVRRVSENRDVSPRTEHQVLIDDVRRRGTLAGNGFHKWRVAAADLIVAGVVVGRPADEGERVQIGVGRDAQGFQQRRREEDDVAGDRGEGGHPSRM